MSAKIRFQAKPKSGQSVTIEVPQDVKDDVDETYDYLREHPDQEGFVEFESADEVKTWLAQARAYCATREAGALKFRQLPSKHLPDTQIRFQLSADLPADGERKTAGKNKAA